MGFTFQVFPGSDEEPSLEQLAERATGLLRGCLLQFPVSRMVALSDTLAEQARNQVAGSAEKARVRFEPGAAPEEGALFTVEPGGGRGGLLRAGLGDWTWYEPEASRIRERGLEERWQRARGLGRRYEISRLLGEPALTGIAHGFVAAALAEATSGFLFSPDGAWDGALMPCSSETFLGSYMRPERSAGERFRRYAEDKLRALPAELAFFDFQFVESVLDQIASRMVREMNQVRGDRRAELAVLDRALAGVETARVISGGCREVERRLLVGSEACLSCDGDGTGGAIARLHPTPEEYERWLGHIGEMLP